jgi:hypothetical protein
MQKKGNQLEETLQLERMKQMRTLEEGRMLEETLQQNMLQQSHHAHFQQAVDVKNQQLEAQIARTQQENAESDSKLSQQNEQMNYLRAHYESHRTRELSLLQANTSLHYVDTKAPAQPSKEWQPSPELRNSAGGNPTRSDEPTPPTFEFLSGKPKRLTSPPELRNQAEGEPSSKAENGTQKPKLFEEKVPAPVYNMAQDDHEHWETSRQESQRRYKESESCHFNHQPTVHNFKHWWLIVKKEVAKASGIPDKRVPMDLESRGH